MNGQWSCLLLPVSLAIMYETDDPRSDPFELCEAGEVLNGNNCVSWSHASV